ncbi:MAG: heavy-metal-associated domain-containing protein [Myxococcota bacterium]
MNTERETVLDVEGMSCGSCVRHVTAALTDLEGVAKVEVKLRDGLVVVRHDPARSSISQLVKALDEAGYPSSEHNG